MVRNDFYKMNIDQEWVRENIDLVTKEFMKIHPQTSQQNKSKHKKRILEDMDTFSYRPIYYIAKHSRDREMVLREKVRQALRERDEYKAHLGVWKSKYESAAAARPSMPSSPIAPQDPLDLGPLSDIPNTKG